jgi:benzoyl-CoA reductase subunit B
MHKKAYRRLDMENQDKKAKVINRLDTRKIVRPMVNKMYSEGVHAAKEGRPVAWSMVHWWEGDLIMRAMDVTPVYPENYGTVCASSGAAQKYQGLSEAEGFPTHICGYASNCLGYTVEMKKLGRIPPDAPLGGMPEPSFMLGSGIGCDTRFKWFQALRRYWDVPVWVIDTPSYDIVEDITQDVHEKNIAYKRRELVLFIDFLEDLLGKKLDMDRLDEYVKNQELVFRLWWKINEMRKIRPCPVHSRDFWTLMVPGYYMTSDKESLALYQQVYDEVKARIDAGIGAVPDEKYRLMFAELPPWHSLDFFERLAHRGWNFVVESQGYHPPEPMTWEPTGDVLERLARWTYWSTIGHMKKAQKKGYPLIGDFFCQAYGNWAREYKIDGFISHSLISCRTATFWLTHIMNELKESLNIPGMNFQGDIVDFTVFEPDEILNNAQAFEDSMDHHRELRKARGLGW